MRTPPLYLDKCYLAKLHIDFVLPEGVHAAEVKMTESAFDYVIASHKEDPRRKMLRLKSMWQELDANKQKAGYTIECEIVGFFSFTEDTPKGREEAVIRMNGVSQLYGVLRGIVATATGVCVGGCFHLPSIMPQDIVEQVESRNAAPQPTAERRPNQRGRSQQPNLQGEVQGLKQKPPVE